MYLLTEWEGRTGKYLARGQEVASTKEEFFFSGSYLRLKKATKCHLNQPGRTGEH